MELWELFNTPIDELYDRGILLEPEPERNVRMCTLTFTCVLCGDEYTERYARNNPDKLSRGMYCTVCNAPSMFLVRANPWTRFYKSRAVEHASFGDDVSGECWLCGTREQLVATTFSNDQAVKLCREHLKPFAKEAYKARQRKQAWRQASGTSTKRERT